MSNLLPAIKQEFLIQEREHCGRRLYAIAGRVTCCGVCGTPTTPSAHPWEIHTPDTTPKQGGILT